MPVREDRVSDELFYKTLRMVSPGTPLHEGLESILRARTGALIVIGDSEEVMSLVNGGFRIDAELNPPPCTNWPKWTEPSFFPPTQSASSTPTRS